jgi:hypothetical protein
MRRCRFCKCSEMAPCINPGTGDTCMWLDEDLCSFCAMHSLHRFVSAITNEWPDWAMGVLEFWERYAFAHAFVRESISMEAWPEYVHTEAARLYRAEANREACA